MPHYYFNLHDETETRDEEGRDCPDLAAARAVAIGDARSLAAAQVMTGRLNLGHRIEIEDASGTVVATVRFREAVKVEG